MKCYWCDTELIIGGDIDIEEGMNGYPEFSVMTNLSCPKCFSEVEILKKEMPSIEIPDIEILEIYIPDVPEIYSPHYFEIAKPPDIDVPGCTYQHRDIKNTDNRNLLLEDPNGVYTTCDFPFPSFVPLDYTPENLVITEEAPVNNETPPLPETQTPDAKIPEKKEEEIVIPDCPGKNDRRVGEFTSELRTERVKGYKRGEDGIECIAIYEDVPFIDQYIPTASAVVNTVIIATVAASTPLLLNVIKPLVKQVINKFTKKKKEK